jgi:hypothetical protein
MLQTANHTWMNGWMDGWQFEVPSMEICWKQWNSLDSLEDTNDFIRHHFAGASQQGKRKEYFGTIRVRLWLEFTALLRKGSIHGVRNPSACVPDTPVKIHRVAVALVARGLCVQLAAK